MISSHWPGIKSQGDHLLVVWSEPGYLILVSFNFLACCSEDNSMNLLGVLAWFSGMAYVRTFTRPGPKGMIKKRWPLFSQGFWFLKRIRTRKCHQHTANQFCFVFSAKLKHHWDVPWGAGGGERHRAWWGVGGSLLLEGRAPSSSSACLRGLPKRKYTPNQVCICILWKEGLKISPAFQRLRI